MKFEKENDGFRPITITLETEQDLIFMLVAMWTTGVADVDRAQEDALNRVGPALPDKIANYIFNREDDEENWYEEHGSLCSYLIRCVEEML